LTLLGIEEDTSSTVVKKDIARPAEVQQPTAEHNDFEEASFAAQQAPVTDEEMAASIPNAQVLTSPDDLVYANQAIDSDVGKIIDEPIAPVLTVAPSESLVNSIVSSNDALLLLFRETKIRIVIACRGRSIFRGRPAEGG
jgi:hypothetical protein